MLGRTPERPQAIGRHWGIITPLPYHGMDAKGMSIFVGRINDLSQKELLPDNSVLGLRKMVTTALYSLITLPFPISSILYL